MRETCDRATVWAWRVWGGNERPKELQCGSLAGQCGNFRFEEEEGMGRACSGDKQ